jgi:hypothetical protein
MPKKPVNHPPTPAVESPTDPGTGVDCEALKAKYGLNVDTYAEHEEPKSAENQSHHILQNACVEDYISKAEGLCVLLANSHSGTPHQVTTARQNERRDNKRGSRGGTQPATNVAGLKDLSQGDLTASFKAANIPDPDAGDLAKCLVDEAEAHMKKAAKRDKGKDVKPTSPVTQTGGCFSAGTPVWLNVHSRREISTVAVDDVVEGSGGPRRVVRRDWCRSELVRLQLAGGGVALAPFHRVLTPDGRYRRADVLRAGMLVQTDGGPEAVINVARDPRPHRIYSFAVGEPFDCRVGRAGLWVEVPDTGAPVTRIVRLTRFRRRIPASKARRKGAGSKS